MKKIVIMFFVVLSSCFADSISLFLENDLVAGTDQSYTHGTRIQWLSNTNLLWGGLLDYVDAFDNRYKYVGFNLSQYIYTPSSKEESEWLPNDRPYCGWLYGGFMFFAESDKNLDFFEIDVGTIGKYSYAKETQTFIHELIDSQLPMGWDNQIEDEFGMNFIYQHKYLKNIDINYFDLQFIPHGGGCFGNVQDYIDSGLLIRIGHNIPKDFGIIRMEPASRLSRNKLDKLGYYVFVDVDGKYVVKNLTIDGNTKYGPNNIEKEKFVGELSYGLNISFDRFNIFYCFNIVTKEFNKQENMEKYGSVGLSWNF